MITRRGILGILAAGFAPAAIGSGVLMPVRNIGTFRHFENWDIAWDRSVRPKVEFIISEPIMLSDIPPNVTHILVTGSGEITIGSRDTVLVTNVTEYFTYGQRAPWSEMKKNPRRSGEKTTIEAGSFSENLRPRRLLERP